MSYRSLWIRAARNYILGTLVSVVPAFAFYTLAFDYTPRQLRLLALLALPVAAIFLAVDLSVLTVVLAPVQRMLAPGAARSDIAPGAARLTALPVLVLPRIFGLHAVCATLVSNLFIVWANHSMALGIASKDFPIYWLLNLTVVPVAHSVFEYHATERLIQQPMAQAVENLDAQIDAGNLVRLPLANRLFLFSGLLALAPLVTVIFIFYQRWQATGQAFPAGLLSQLVVVGASLTLLWMLLLGLVSREVGEQTRSITTALDRIAGGDLTTSAPVSSTSEFGRIALAVNEMAAGLRERQRIRDLFGSYLTREVATQLLDPSRLPAAERKRVTVLFVDLRDFTALSSQHPVETVLDLLNQFFAQAVAAIGDERGHVNKFLGDGVLAVFGAPLEIPDAADCALRAAIGIRSRVAELNKSLAARSLPCLRMGAGLHTGEVIAGTVGVPERKLEYTVIGDTVNLASRLEALNKPFGTDILLSEDTAAELKGKYSLTKMPPADVRGVPRPVVTFSVAL